MARPKRKRNPTRTKPNKRSKYNESSDSEASDRPKIWEADCILEEKVVRGIKKYHIKWKGTDPDTGRDWPNTWEPEEHAKGLLVAEWEEEKARKSGHNSRRRSEQRRGVQASGRIRNSRVIESSLESSNRSSSTSSPSTPAHNKASSVNLSSTTNTSVCARSRRPSPRVQIRRRGDSLARDEFKDFSQIVDSQNTSTQAHSQDSNLGSSQLFAVRPRPYSSGIVPDSQSSTGEASFIPITQRTEDTNQQSTGCSRLTEEEEDLVDDSGFLKIVQQPKPHVVSPARSIPETIPDTTVADSQSQHHRGEALGALELVPSLSQAEQVTTGDHAEVTTTKSRSGIEPSTPVGSSRVDQEQASLSQTIAETVEANSLEFVDIEEISISPRNLPTSLDNSQILAADISDVDRGTQIQVAADTFGEEHQAPQKFGDRDSQPSLAEHSISEDGQFPFHYQRPIRDLQHQTPLRPASAQEDCINSSQHSADHSAPLTTQVGQALTGPGQIQRTALSDSLFDPPHQPVHSQAQDDNLSISLVRSARSPSPQDPPCALEIREQNAQVVPLEVVQSTQEENTPHSIRTAIEKEYSTRDRASSESRHDSSQETPGRLSSFPDHNLSPVPYPSSYSLRTQASKLPSRPCTPVPSSSTMANESTADAIKRQMEEALAKQKAENPYTPKRRNNTSSATPSATTSATAPEGSTASQTSKLLRTAEQEGTRSPSAVPDRSPAVQVPTSLRTVASAPVIPQEPPPQDETPAAASAAPSEPAEAEDVAEDAAENVAEAEDAAPAESSVPDVPPSAGSDQMDLSDADDEENDDDNESLLNDDLQLSWGEFVVPLYIQGRQSDMYSQYIASKKEILEQFLEDPRSVDPISQVEEILSYLRAIETHIDLVFAEADSGSSSKEMSATQLEHAAQFGMENSTKFRFLHELFNQLRDTDTHIVIVTEEDDDALYAILETFCRANKVHFDIPRRGEFGESKGGMNVSIVPQTGCPIMRFSDIIICLDGIQDATEIRERFWAQSTERAFVPIIHLVIPRTVGHIERYVSPNLGPVERMHTILASLAHMREDIGKPIVETTPRDAVCAALICAWLKDTSEDSEFDWPIPSIGSIKDVIEYQTQQSQPLVNSPVPERVKRPLDRGDLDPAKRMRFTPQPQTLQSSTAEHDQEVTRIIDSMPSNAARHSDLQKRLAHMEALYRTELEARRAEEKRFREHEEMWDKQQTVHENLMNEYRIMSQKQKAAETKLESLTKSNATLTERLTARTSEVRELEKQLKEQRATHLLSPDEQILEITNLRKALATAHLEREKAIKNASTSDALLEYTRTSYQDAQYAAAASNARIADLEAQVTKLTQAASDQASRLKGLHLGRSHELQEKHIRTLKAELNIVKKALQNKDEEVTRLKSLGRQGVGTRGTSVTPQPKIRSRAGSPSLLGGRLSNLRNG